MRAFYDDMAEDYHLIFRDWDASMEYQASVLAAVIEAGFAGGVGGDAGDVGGGGSVSGFGGVAGVSSSADAGSSGGIGSTGGVGGGVARRVLDCSCGIGTQAIGLARIGEAEVIGTDLSPRAAARASREAAARGVGLPAAAADMQALPFRDGTFDVVLSADNAVPHLLTPDALTTGLAEMRRVLRPDGLLVATVRDYDELRAQHPASTPPQVSEHEAGRAINFQLWHWHPDGERYDLEYFQLVPSDDRGWDVRVRRATYWALTRKQLGEFAAEVGFRDVAWQEPAESGYYQPMMTARR